jgi:putative ABC transport system permease protein
LILLANIVAWPIAYYIIHGWLQNFSYRISIQVWVFILSGILSFAFAVFAAGYRSMLAATKNPIESLRHE